jgi:hypothetical protein
LNRIASHEVLSLSSDLQTFFEMENAEGISVKQAVKKDKQPTPKEEGGSGSGGNRLLSFLGSSIESISSMTVTNQADPDQWFDAKKNYINSLETQMNALIKAADNMLRKEKGKEIIHK